MKTIKKERPFCGYCGEGKYKYKVYGDPKIKSYTAIMMNKQGFEKRLKMKGFKSYYKLPIYEDLNAEPLFGNAPIYNPILDAPKTMNFIFKKWINQATALYREI